jgi:hypothetical protein
MGILLREYYRRDLYRSCFGQADTLHHVLASQIMHSNQAFLKPAEQFYLAALLESSQGLGSSSEPHL